MKLDNKVYDVLKWIALIAIPAFNVAYSTLAPLWGLEYVAQITGTLNVVATLIGTLIGISTAKFNKDKAQSDAGEDKE